MSKMSSFLLSFTVPYNCMVKVPTFIHYCLFFQHVSRGIVKRDLVILFFEIIIMLMTRVLEEKNTNV